MALEERLGLIKLPILAVVESRGRTGVLPGHGCVDTVGSNTIHVTVKGGLKSQRALEVFVVLTDDESKLLLALCGHESSSDV